MAGYAGPTDLAPGDRGLLSREHYAQEVEDYIARVRERREKARLEKELEKDRDLGVDGETRDDIIATANKNADNPAILRVRNTPTNEIGETSAALDARSLANLDAGMRKLSLRSTSLGHASGHSDNGRPRGNRSVRDHLPPGNTILTSTPAAWITALLLKAQPPETT
jgi:hypothetical protein